MSSKLTIYINIYFNIQKIYKIILIMKLYDNPSGFGFPNGELLARRRSWTIVSHRQAWLSIKWSNDNDFRWSTNTFELTMPITYYAFMRMSKVKHTHIVPLSLSLSFFWSVTYTHIYEYLPTEPTKNNEHRSFWWHFASKNAHSQNKSYYLRTFTSALTMAVLELYDT